MTTAFKPLKSVNTLLLVGIMATAALAATAQTVAPPAAPAPSATPAKVESPRGHRHDPAKMQTHIAKRQAELKTKLAITPAQEGAWSAYTAAIQPPAHNTADYTALKAELEKLTTPQRIDKMRELRAQRTAEMNAAMDKRGEATKALYSALSADQKKVMDSQRMDHGGMGHKGRHGHHHKA